MSSSKKISASIANPPLQRDATPASRLRAPELARWGSQSMRLRQFIVLVVLLPSSAFAAEMAAISTTRVDPNRTCGVLESHLPKNLSAFRTVGKLLREVVATTSEYDCDQIEGGCKVHVFEYPGLELDVRVSGISNSPWVMGATTSSPKWRLFENIHVGQTLEIVEEHYGVTIPRGKSPVVLEGECTPLTIWHRNGRVTKLALDCQACY